MLRKRWYRNRHFNLRYLWLLNANADYSFLFTLHTGERQNKHLKAEYLAVLETNHGTPYFMNLHYQDTAHTVVLGRTGSGKSFFLNFLITNLQKYDPYTFIFDLGWSFRSVTQLFGGAYLQVSAEHSEFTINPFRTLRLSLPRFRSKRLDPSKPTRSGNHLFSRALADHFNYADLSVLIRLVPI